MKNAICFRAQIVPTTHAIESMPKCSFSSTKVLLPKVNSGWNSNGDESFCLLWSSMLLPIAQRLQSWKNNNSYSGCIFKMKNSSVTISTTLMACCEASIANANRHTCAFHSIRSDLCSKCFERKKTLKSLALSVCLMRMRQVEWLCMENVEWNSDWAQCADV